jgi:hypothetical protein
LREFHGFFEPHERGIFGQVDHGGRSQWEVPARDPTSAFHVLLLRVPDTRMKGQRSKQSVKSSSPKSLSARRRGLGSLRVAFSSNCRCRNPSLSEASHWNCVVSAQRIGCNHRRTQLPIPSALDSASGDVQSEMTKKRERTCTHS